MRVLSALTGRLNSVFGTAGISEEAKEHYIHFVPCYFGYSAWSCFSSLSFCERVDGLVKCFKSEQMERSSLRKNFTRELSLARVHSSQVWLLLSSYLTVMPEALFHPPAKSGYA